MPGEKASRAGRWIGEVLKVVVAPAVTCLIAYVVYADFRAWVWQLVGRVGPLLVVAGGLGAIGVAGVLLRGVWAAVRRRVMGWYEKAVWVMSKPVREELAVRLAEARGVATVAGEGRPVTSATGAVNAEGAGPDDDCRRAVADLSVSALQVLFRALEKYDQRSDIVVHLELNDLRPAWVGTTEDVSLNMVRDGCKELRRAGFIKRHWTFFGTRGQAVRIRLADCLSGRAAARRVRESLSDELVNRGVWRA